MKKIFYRDMINRRGLIKQTLTLFFLLIFSTNYFVQPSFSENQDIYQEVYLTEKQALDLVFQDLKVEKKEITPSKEQIQIIQKLLKRKIKENSFTFYIGKKADKVIRYALILNEKGKHEPITFIVSLNDKAVVEQVALMVYREKRGAEVKQKRFLNQFKEKSSADPLEVNVDIIHVTGATISSWAIAAGVKKAIILTKELCLKNDVPSRKTGG